MLALALVLFDVVKAAFASFDAEWHSENECGGLGIGVRAGGS